MIQTTIMKGDSEVVRYDCPGIPLYIRTAQLSSYPERRALCHWHDDLEWVHILEGSMNYYINGHRITLKTGRARCTTVMPSAARRTAVLSASFSTRT